MKAHLAATDVGHATLCNVKARRWKGRQLVPTKPRVVTEQQFNAMGLSEQCGRCFLAQCARDGVPVVRQRA